MGTAMANIVTHDLNSLSFQTTQCQNKPFRVILIALVRAQRLLSDTKLISKLALGVLPGREPNCELVIGHFQYLTIL